MRVGLSEDALAASHDLPDANWGQWLNDLAGIGRYEVLRPDFGLVLRHASGVVFQDAHLAAELTSDAWLPGFERPVHIGASATPAETGVYFTPPAIARTLAEEAIRPILNANAALRVFDPACGSGELLKECLRLLALRGHQGRVHILGWDKSTAAVEIANFVLRWEQRSWPANQVEVQIVQSDSLIAPDWPIGQDIVLMNPPFRSWQRMSAEEQARVTDILGGSNRPNLGMAFARRAVDALADSGTLAMIVPNSLLEATSGRQVREQLAENLTPRLIARLGDQTIFARALVDAGMYVGTKEAHPVVSKTAILWADSKPNSLNRALRGLRRWRGAEIEPLSEDGFSVYERREVGKTGAPWVARSHSAWRSYEEVSRKRVTVPAKKLFDIHQGVRLGSDVFVLTQSQLAELPTRERAFFRPAVMNPSISEGRLVGDYFVFYPYSSGLPSIESEEDLHTRVRTYFTEYLLPAKQKLASRKTLSKADLNWWELLWHRSWQTDITPKLVSKYFGASHPFAFDRDGDYVVVVGNAWLLKPGVLTLAATPNEVYAATLAFLSSSVAEDLIKYVSVQVAGGQWDLSNKYLGALPILDVERLAEGRFAQLAQLGMQISDGTLKEWSVIDEVVAAVLTS